MADVATAANDSSDDRSGTENKESDDEDNELGDEDVDSDATVNLDLRNALLKNKELTKALKVLRAQYNRVVKQKDDNVRKQTVALDNRRSMYDALKTRHKTEVSNLKNVWKTKEKEVKDTHRGELVSKSMDNRKLQIQVGQLERDKTSDTSATEKLEASILKDKASLSQVKVLYVEARRKCDDLAQINKDLASSCKLLKKKTTDDQSVRFEHEEKILNIQLQRDTLQYEREKDRREDREASDKASLEAKSAHTLLQHSLRERTKNDDLIRRDVAKRKKEVQVSNNVGLIAAGLRNKQMQINNGQFNTHVSLEEVSFVTQ
jgi:hypothetical protein